MPPARRSRSRPSLSPHSRFARPFQLILILGVALGAYSACQPKKAASDAKAWPGQKQDEPAPATSAQTPPATDVSNCSPEMLKNQVLRSPTNLGDFIVWRIDSCVPPQGGAQSALFKELRVTSNLMLSSKFDVLTAAFRRPQSGTMEVTLPENVVELSILGGALGFVDLTKVYVVAAPVVTLDATQGSACGLRASSIKLGLSGVRVGEKSAASPIVVAAAESLFTGDHFVGRFVHGLIIKAVDWNLQNIKPFMGCTGTPPAPGNGP